MAQTKDTAGRRLLEARKHKGWTQEQLGVAMGFSADDGRVRVSRWENGKTKLKLEDMEAAATAMGLPTFALLPHEEIQRTAEWIVAAARHKHELPPEYRDQFAAAIETITQAMGPLPAADDDAGWASPFGVRAPALAAKRPTLCGE